MNDILTLGYSPCPNDTFIFHALVHGISDPQGLSFAEPQLEDVEQLNSWAVASRLAVSKLSFSALGQVLDDYSLLATGSALGRGCGPLLVSGRYRTRSELARGRIAIPGQLTTAALLLKLFLPEHGELVEMRFDRIMAAIGKGEVDAGVIIHESRFTYGALGLVCLQDLGKWWEETSGLPIPLGCIAAKRSLGADIHQRLELAIRASVEHAFANPQASLPYIRRWSQEMEEEVVSQHIGLYVNEFSRNLGKEGLAAVETLLLRAREVGALPESEQPLLLTGRAQ